MARTLVNNGGIWANIKPEVLYDRGNHDQAGADLNGDNVYTLTFPKDGLPAQYATFFWSVIAVDGVRFRVLPNPLNRFLINNQSKLQYGPDGSLTLYFADQKPADAPDGNWLPTPNIASRSASTGRRKAWRTALTTRHRWSNDDILMSAYGP